MFEHVRNPPVDYNNLKPVAPEQGYTWCRYAGIPPGESDVHLTGLIVTPKANGIFQRTMPIFVGGSINMSHFHYEGTPDDFPSQVMTMETASVFRSIVFYNRQQSIRSYVYQWRMSTNCSKTHTGWPRDWWSLPSRKFKFCERLHGLHTHTTTRKQLFPFLHAAWSFVLSQYHWVGGQCNWTVTFVRTLTIIAVITAAALKRVNPVAAPPMALREKHELQTSVVGYALIRLLNGATWHSAKVCSVNELALIVQQNACHWISTLIALCY